MSYYINQNSFDTRVISIVSNTEPVTLQEAKNYIRIRHDKDNDLITSQISTARELAETYLSRDILPRQREVYMQVVDQPFKLLWAPIDTTVDITMTVDGVSFTDFKVNGFADPTIIVDSYGDYNGEYKYINTRNVKVQYTTAGLVDSNIKQGVLAAVAFLYYGRDAKMSTNYTAFLAPHKTLFV